MDYLLRKTFLFLLLGNISLGGKSTFHINVNLLPKSCGELSNEQYHFANHPWEALLALRKEEKGEALFECGGVLISQRYVLTAAHCVNTKDSIIYVDKVRFGETRDAVSVQSDCKLPCQDFGVEEVLVHNDFERVLNDIALIRLRQEIPANSHIFPVCISLQSELTTDDLDGRKLETGSWLLKNFDLKKRKHNDSAVVVNLDLCREKWSNQLNIPSSMVCTVSKAGDCYFLSGSPLLRRDTKEQKGRWNAVAVNSFSPELCGNEQAPAGHTNIGFHIKWILDNMRP